MLAGALVVAHGLALAAAWVGLSGWGRYLAGIVILLSLAHALLRARWQALSLELHDDGRALWRNREGSWHEGRLGRANFASAALVVLDLECKARGRKWVVLMPDSMPSEDFRRLRVQLRWRRSPIQPDRNNLTGN